MKAWAPGARTGLVASWLIPPAPVMVIEAERTWGRLVIDRHDHPVAWGIAVVVLWLAILLLFAVWGKLGGRLAGRLLRRLRRE